MKKIPRSVQALLYVGVAIALVFALQTAFKGAFFSEKGYPKTEKGYNDSLMQRAMDLSAENASEGENKSAALIVKDGKVIAEATSSVIADKDPTAHAEINAIRIACRKRRVLSLEGCQLYVTKQPCALCQEAIRCVKPDTVYLPLVK